MHRQRHAFIISDRTGLTAESMAQALLSQFPEVDFVSETVSFVDSLDKAEVLAVQLDQLAQETGEEPLLFLTMVDGAIAERLTRDRRCVYDLFNTFIGPLERDLGQASSHTVGKSHGVSNTAAYNARMLAVHYAMQNDERCVADALPGADLVLLGVSRCGKSPVSLFLALQYGLRVAAWPLVESALESEKLPDDLQPFRHKLFGMNISAERLSEVRRERYADSRYSDRSTCQREVMQAEQLFNAEQIPCLDISRMSVEEIGAMILQSTRLQHAL